jgi:hypothetical protein
MWQCLHRHFYCGRFHRSDIGSILTTCFKWNVSPPPLSKHFDTTLKSYRLLQVWKKVKCIYRCPSDTSHFTKLHRCKEPKFRADTRNSTNIALHVCSSQCSPSCTRLSLLFAAANFVLQPILSLTAILVPYVITRPSVQHYLYVLQWLLQWVNRKELNNLLIRFMHNFR